MNIKRELKGLSFGNLFPIDLKKIIMYLYDMIIKLNSDVVSANHFKGVFTSERDMNQVDGVDGDYADLYNTTDGFILRYIWDKENDMWVKPTYINKEHLPEFTSANDAASSLDDGEFFVWSEDNIDGIIVPEKSYIIGMVNKIIFVQEKL